MSMEQFLTEGLPSLDSVLNERVIGAKKGGNVLRYVATVVQGRYAKFQIVELMSVHGMNRKATGFLLSYLKMHVFFTKI